MVTINDLTGISSLKRGEIIRCLDELLTFRSTEDRLSPVITGYNLYTRSTQVASTITLSHIHETERYKREMIHSLVGGGYSASTIEEYIREKVGVFLWKLFFEICDERGNTLQGLRIKDRATQQYVDLTKYDKPLEAYTEFKDQDDALIGEDAGWQLDIPFNNKKELMFLVNLFLKKSGKHIYDADGSEIPESEEEKLARNPWSDAYQIPVLLIGQEALAHASELPQFTRVIRLVLKENGNEISFVVNRSINRLRSLSAYETLRRLGFKEEPCLVNASFANYLNRCTKT